MSPLDGIVYASAVLTILRSALSTIPKFISTVLIKSKNNSNFHLGELCLKLIHVNTMASAVDMRVESGRIFPYEREADNCTPCPQ